MWRSCPAGTRGASLLLAPVSVPMRRGGEGKARRYTSPVVSFVYIVHLVSVRETARALSLCFVLFFALILPSGCVGMERWHALFSASKKIFCIRGWLGNSLGDITPCLCRLIVCHGKAIHPYTTSFLPRLPEINFPFCLFPIETDPKHVCLATHTDTSPPLRHAGGCGRREREATQDGNKVTLFSSAVDPAVPERQSSPPAEAAGHTRLFLSRCSFWRRRPHICLPGEAATSCRYSTSGRGRQQRVVPPTNAAIPPWRARGIR